MALILTNLFKSCLLQVTKLYEKAILNCRSTPLGIESEFFFNQAEYLVDAVKGTESHSIPIYQDTTTPQLLSTLQQVDFKLLQLRLWFVGGEKSWKKQV